METRLFLFTVMIPALFLVSGVSAQVSVDSIFSDPDYSAMLDIRSTTKGLLIPRLTTSQINTMLLPARGLLVFNRTTGRLMINQGEQWLPDWQSLATGDPGATYALRTTTVLGNAGLAGGGDLSADRVINHLPGTWGQADLTGNNVIKNLTSDAFGHPTGWITRQLTTDDIPEGTNLYFTGSRALGASLAGFAVGPDTADIPSDHILTASGKMQGQIDARLQDSLYAAFLFVGDNTNTAAGVALTGDASVNATGVMTVTGLRGTPVSPNTPATNQILQFNGSSWSPADPAGQGLTGSETNGNLVKWTGTSSVANSLVRDNGPAAVVSIPQTPHGQAVYL